MRLSSENNADCGRFTDADVLKEDFAERIKGIAVVMAPFVHK